MTGTFTDDIHKSEAIVVMHAIRTGGAFLDDLTLKPNDFLSNEAAWALDAMLKMQALDVPIDMVTVGDYEPRVAAWVWANADWPTSNAEYHATVVHDAVIRRRMSNVGAAITQNSAVLPVAELIDSSRKLVDDAAGLRQASLTFVGDKIDHVIKEATGPRTVYPTPWTQLTGILGGGFRPGGLYVLAARPAVGKSAFALQMAQSLAGEGFVAMASLEMPDEEIIRRLIAQGAEIPHHLLERGEPLPSYAVDKIARWRDLSPMTIAIDDRSTVGIADIRAFARSVKRHGHLSGVVVDYLQLISGPVGQNRVEVVSEITRQLKIMARDLECPVIALSQLNRNPEGRMDKRPILADLRESGSIEQDADVVMLLFKPDDVQNLDPFEPPRAQPIELNVAKNRHGAAQKMDLWWEGSQMRAFENEWRQR